MENDKLVINELALRIANLEVEKANVVAVVKTLQQQIAEKDAKINELENQGGEK